MDTEYEAKFINIDKEALRIKLRRVGAVLVKPEFLQKRINFHFPAGHQIDEGWIRVRDESGKITMSVKAIENGQMDGQKEICLGVNDFTVACNLLKTIGCVEKAYQETKREVWSLDGVEISIDEWPFLGPFAEIEGLSETAVKSIAEKLGFDWGQARFGVVTAFYHEKYGVSPEIINNQTPKIVFDMPNPLI